MLFSESDILVLVYTSICIVYAQFKFINTPLVHFKSFAFLPGPCAADESQLHTFDLHACELAFFLQLPQQTDSGVACHAQTV